MYDPCSTFAAAKTPMANTKENKGRAALLGCLLLFGFLQWFPVVLHATGVPGAVFELNALPSDQADQNDGPYHDPDAVMATLHGTSLRGCALVSSRLLYVPDVDRGGCSLLPVAGLQPSAP